MPPKKTPRPAARRSPRQQRAHDTVSIILEAAQQILRQHGLAGFNTNRIAERAGVGIGSLYGYFPNKQSILLALARRLLAADGQAFLAALDDVHAAPADPVRRLVRVLLERHRHEPQVRQVLLGAYMGAGLAGDDARQVGLLADAVAAHPQGPLATQPLGPVQFFVVTRAVLGVARALTEAPGEPPLPAQLLEDEAVRLVKAYLLAVSSTGAETTPAASSRNKVSSSARTPSVP